MAWAGKALKSAIYVDFRPPILACDFGTIFGGGMPTESRSFSSEKSYSPSRLTWPLEITEWLATAARISCHRSSQDRRDRILSIFPAGSHPRTPESGLNSRPGSCRFTYLCVKEPQFRPAGDLGQERARGRC